MPNLNISQTLACTIAAGLALAPTLNGNAADSDPIIAPGAELKELFNDAHFTEGPTVAPDGTVYFSDITFTYETDMQAGHIMRYNPETGETTVFRSPSGMSNGMEFDAQGRLVIAEGADFGGRRITRTDMETGKSEIIAGLYNGKPFNSPNDLTIDEQGRIYFTDPRYAGHEPVEQPIFGVYRIDPDGSVHLVVTDGGKPNGVAVSPDQKTLYVISHDNGAMGNLPMRWNRVRDAWHSSLMTSHRKARRHSERCLLTTHLKTGPTAWSSMQRGIFGWQCAMRPVPGFAFTRLKGKNWRTLRHQINRRMLPSDTAKQAKRST